MSDQETKNVRVDEETRAELARIAAEFRAEHGGTITFGTIIKRMLADRKAARP